MSVRPTILKLGGSVITIKKKPFTPNEKAITRLAEEINRANVTSLVLVHGGGSFGHPIAEKFRIKEGLKSPSQLMGFSKTRQAVTALNCVVMDSLISLKIPAVALHPSSFVVTKSGRIHTIDYRPIVKLLKIGFVPTLFGDAVLDLETGFTILSGDQLASSLAMKLDAKRIIMGIDVDGLHVADPKVDPTARLIQHISLKELKCQRYKVEKAKVTDVTEGMQGKVLALMPAIERGIPTMIINALKPNNVYLALVRDRVKGTLIEKT